MTVYGHFTPTPYFDTEIITDVADILTKLTDMLVTVPQASEKWTESPSGTFTSQPDGSGRFVKLVFSAASTLRLDLNVYDQNGLSVNSGGVSRELVITGGDTVRYYTCSRFVYLQGEPDHHVGGGLVTAFPEAEGGNANYCYSHGFHNQAGASDGVGDLAYYSMFDNGTPGISRRLQNPAIAYNSTQLSLVQGTGSLTYTAVQLYANYAGINKTTGRIFNAYLCDSSLANGATKTLPIGSAGETGVFRVLGTDQVGGTNIKMMLRIA
jgi:hypothetical protein